MANRRNQKCVIASYLSFALSLLAPAMAFSQPAGQLKSFPLTSVQLLDSPFRQAQQTDLKYILALDPDRLLAPNCAKPGCNRKPKATATGKTPASTAISAAIT